MSLHRTDIHYRGLRIWVESQKAADPYEEATIIQSLNKDFAHMLRAVGADVRAHFQSTAEHPTVVRDWCCQYCGSVVTGGMNHDCKEGKKP